MVAIETKYYPATDRKPARIKAWAGDRPAKWYSYDSDVAADEPNAEFRRAARDYNKQMNWKGEMVEGGTLGGFVYVFANGERVTT